MRLNFASFQPDVVNIDAASASYVNNVMPVPSGWGPMRAAKAFTQALPARCEGVSGIFPSGGTSAIFAGTATKLYRLNAVTRAWDDVSKGGGYLISPKEMWDFAQFGNQVIAVTNSNNVQAYTVDVSAAFADLAGSPPNARRVSVVGDFVVLAGLTNNPSRIQWSGINDTTIWTPGTSQSDFQDFPDGGFVQGVTQGEFGIVLQERAIRRMVYVGPPLIFEFQRISEDRGALMRYSITRAAGMTFFMSNDGFYMIDQGGGLNPIGSQKVNNFILANADLTDQHNMVGKADPLTQKVYWFYRSNGNQNAWLDKVLVYDWVRNEFGHGDLNVYAATTALPLATTLEGLNAVAPLDSLPFSLDAYTSTYSAAIGVVSKDGSLGYLNGDTLEAIIETPEGSLGDGIRRNYITGVAPIGDAAGAKVSIRKRDKPADDPTFSSESGIGVKGFAALRSNARFNAVRVRVPAGEDWSYMRAVEIESRPAGRR